MIHVADTVIVYNCFICNNTFVLCLQEYLTSWGGGNLQEVTAEARIRYLNKLMLTINERDIQLVLLDAGNRQSISDYLGALANQSPSICTTTLAALSSLLRYLNCRRMTSIGELKLLEELKAAEFQLTQWNKSNCGNKKKTNARLRVSYLDKYMIVFNC